MRCFVASLILYFLAAVAEKSNAQGSCSIKADIAFVIDTSKSVGPKNHVYSQKFMTSLVNKFATEVNKGDVRFAAIDFGKRVREDFQLKTHAGSAANTTSAVNKMSCCTYGTVTVQALRFLHSVFDRSKGDRKGVRNFAIILTNSRSNGRKGIRAAKEAQQVRNKGIEIFTVGVGKRITKKNLRDMASDPKDQHILQVKDFKSLQDFVDLLKHHLCNGGAKI